MDYDDYQQFDDSDDGSSNHEPDPLSLLEFHLCGYGGFGGTSHVPKDDKDPAIVVAAREGDLHNVKSLVAVTGKGKKGEQQLIMGTPMLSSIFLCKAPIQPWNVAHNLTFMWMQ
jgi:hypothetical protein